MSEPALVPERAAEVLGRLEDSIHRVIVGKDRSVRLAITALVAGGHILLEDLPGTGKTMLARALATSVGGSFRRIQCTPDLLPADITGASIFNQRELSFDFVPGPIFANLGPGRRGEPGDPPDAVGSAGGDGGGTGHR